MRNACAVLFGLILGLMTSTEALATKTTPGELRSDSTIHSIGIEWDISGDTDHDAKCTVQFRRKGSDAWRPALPLFRVHYAWWYHKTKPGTPLNLFAGSVLFLHPGTEYEVKLDLADPDGGADTRLLSIRTRPIPTLAANARTLHVVPGTGRGAGAPDDPLKGLDPAQAAARPGDVLLLHKGTYGHFNVTKSGEPRRYIAWKSAGDGQAVFKSIDVAANHVWLEGLTLKREQRPNGLRAQGAATDVVVIRDTFTGFHYSVLLSPEARNWYIADNVIVGDNDPHLKGRPGISGEGVELSHSEGHVVCYNRISRVADGISYCQRNCDMYGNDIFDVSDDGLEPDYGFANNRMWGNRIYNYQHAALSFQPMKCGPWYFIRNQVIGSGQIFKFRVQDRFLLAHNTFVRWGSIGGRMHHILTSLSRNNLYISAGGKPSPIWVAYDCKQPQYCLPNNYKRTWMTDVDYDGFDWSNAKSAFRWENKKYFPDLKSFVGSFGIETHGIRVHKQNIFARYNVPDEPGSVAAQYLPLKPGCAAIDAGAILPNVNDAFAGKAPDLGAYEYGKPLPHYGPRDAKAMKDHAAYWALY